VAVIITFLNQQTSIQSSQHSDLYVWGLFSTISLLGALATLFPHVCGRLDHQLEEFETVRASAILGLSVVHGHHPLCAEFQGHEFKFKGKSFCAGCTGILIGVCTALVITTLHFIFDIPFVAATAYIGLGCVVVGLLFIPFKKKDIPLQHSAFHLALVVGFSLVLVGVDGLGSFEFDLVAIGLCIFWMYTRIQLSRWDHDRICGVCGFKCDEKEL